MSRPSSAADTRGLLAFFQAGFERFDADHASDPSWLRTARRKAMARLTELGFPSPHDEEWRFTPLGPLLRTPFEPAQAAAGEQAAGALLPPALSFDVPARLVFVNGRYAPWLSTVRELPPGVRAGSLADALAARPDRLGFHLARTARYDTDPFRALNTAFLHGGAVVEVEPNVIIEDPLHVVFLSAPGAAPAVWHPRTLVVVGENSQVRIIESHAGPDRGRYFTNPVAEIVLGPGAVVDHARVQMDGAQAFHLGSTQATVGRQASYTSHVVTFGGSIARSDIGVTLAGEGGSCTLNGLYLASEAQVVDHHTTIDHARPHCTSHELYKGVLGGRARAVFGGKILVRPDAQKTDAKQTNKTLLLSDEAQIDTKPQLEIRANDVKCTHGATVGQLSEEALFYLRTRGVGRDEAKRILIRAFAGDVLGRLPLEALRSGLDALLASRLDEALGIEVAR